MYSRPARPAASRPRCATLIAFLTLLCSGTTQAETIPFNASIVDSEGSGDCKMAGDIDGDGMPDLVVGGMSGEGLSWYHYPSWRKTVVARPEQEFTTDGALGDVDGDGALDIVVPDGEGGENLKWYRNPAPDGDPFEPAQWKEFRIGAIGGWGKDVELADFDRDGRLDVAARHHGAAMIFFQTGPDQWLPSPIAAASLGSEGMASGDIDDDDDTDLVIQGAWLENPGGASARSETAWAEHVIGPAPGDFKALVADLNGDGTMDVLVSASEGTADVQWWTPEQRDPRGHWVAHRIVRAFDRGHTLQAADMDNDGDIDVVLAQMHSSAARQVLILENLDGQATRWADQVLDTTGLHNGVVVDIGNDGDMDIFGANWVGAPPVRLWVNRLDPGRGPLAVDRWTSAQVTSRSERTFGLGFGDLDGDGLDDIVAGRYVHLNPGGDLTEGWTRLELPFGMHGFAVAGLPDNPVAILAQRTEDELALYALSRGGPDDADWIERRLGAVPLATHELGAQGYRIAQIEPGGPPEIVLSSGNGAYYFAAPGPNDPTAPWHRVHVSANPSDEGIAVGDIDGDGHADIAGTTGERKGVEWYRNPADGSDQWAARQIGSFPEAVYPDRVEVADFNGDGRLDIVATEENGEAEGAETYWWEQPAETTVTPWTRHLLTSQATTNSLDVADIDQDGAVDIVTGEHRGAKRIVLWTNDGTGAFTPHEIDRGRESHLGGRTHDLDGDGDLDIVSIGYDDRSDIWLWRNDAIRIAGLNAKAEPEDGGSDGVWFARLRQLLSSLVN